MKPRKRKDAPAKPRRPVGRPPSFTQWLDVPTGRRGPDGQLLLGADGRPEVRRARLGDLIAEAVGTGCTYKAAAEMHGAHESMFYRWMAQGRDDRELADQVEKDTGNRPNRTEYEQFCEAVTRACARSEGAIVAEIRKICRDKGDARTLLDLLGRRFPDRWGRVERMELTGADGEPLVPDAIADRTIEEAWREVRERRAERAERRSSPAAARGNGDGAGRGNGRGGNT